MIFQNPLKNKTHTIDMLMIGICSTVLAVIGFRADDLWILVIGPLMVIYASFCNMFLEKSKKAKWFCTVILLLILAYTVYHDFVL